MGGVVVVAAVVVKRVLRAGIRAIVVWVGATYGGPAFRYAVSMVARLQVQFGAIHFNIGHRMRIVDIKYSRVTVFWRGIQASGRTASCVGNACQSCRVHIHRGAPAGPISAHGARICAQRIFVDAVADDCWFAASHCWRAAGVGWRDEW